MRLVSNIGNCFCQTNNRQNPGIVDEGLAENILRDSCDPGAVGVIAAGGKLPFSRSANEMLGKFGVRVWGLLVGVYRERL